MAIIQTNRVVTTFLFLGIIICELTNYYAYNKERVMSGVRNAAKGFFKNYIGFLVGLSFGATVATLTTYSILGPAEINQENISDIDKLKKCLFD